MKSLMCFKTWALGKGFITSIALVGFLSSMNSLMFCESWLHSKGFATFNTSARFLFIHTKGMKSLVYFKLCQLVKRFVTKVALVVCLSIMNSLVYSEAWGGTEAFPIFPTLYWFLYNVDCFFFQRTTFWAQKMSSYSSCLCSFFAVSSLWSWTMLDNKFKDVSQSSDLQGSSPVWMFICLFGFDELIEASLSL